MDRLLTADLSERWGVTKQTIWMLKNSGLLPFTRRAFHVVEYELSDIQAFEQTPRFEQMARRSRMRKERMKAKEAVAAEEQVAS